MSRHGAYNQYLRNKHKPEIFDFVKDMGLSIKAMQGDWHYRIEDVLDVYPTRKRFFWIPDKEWGWYDDYEHLGRIFLERINI